MKRIAILAFLSCYCLLNSQDITFSKVFETRKKNVPIAIINNHPNYFYVMRYNKDAHDITLERRNKPEAAILSFTPLKLDSVNSSWFDYEKLEHLCFEINHKLYFVFQKEMTAKKTVYLKVIDTTGKSSGFIELASLKKEEGVKDVRLSFSRTEGNCILIAAEQDYTNGTTKKAVILYDPVTLKTIWVKKLPIENSLTDISDGFTANKRNDLLYVSYRIKKYALFKTENNTEQRVIHRFGDIHVVKSYSDSKEIVKHKIGVDNIVAVYGSTLISRGDSTLFCAHLVGEESKFVPYFYVEKLSGDLAQSVYLTINRLPPGIGEKLTFYDGTGENNPAYKNYRLNQTFILGDHLYYVSERKQGIYSSELLVWKANLETGKVDDAFIVPRRVVYFSSSERFKQAGEVMIAPKNDSVYIFSLDHPANLKMTSGQFKFHAMKKQMRIGGGIIVRNVISAGGISRTAAYRNKGFNLIPLNYTGENKTDDVFYFNKGKQEKFGFISSGNPF